MCGFESQTRDWFFFFFSFWFCFVYLQDRNTFTLKLEDTENWLYEDGEDQPKQVYVDKLAELKVSVSTQRYLSLCSFQSGASM